MTRITQPKMSVVWRKSDRKQLRQGHPCLKELRQGWGMMIRSLADHLAQGTLDFTLELGINVLPVSICTVMPWSCFPAAGRPSFHSLIIDPPPHCYKICVGGAPRSTESVLTPPECPQQGRLGKTCRDARSNIWLLEAGLLGQLCLVRALEWRQVIFIS